MIEEAYTGNIEGPKDAPWVVFAQHAIAREEPNTDAPVVERLRQGDKVTGLYHINHQTDEEWIVADREGETLYVPRWRLMRIHPDNETGGNIPVGQEKVNRWWALPLEYEADDLVVLPVKWRFEDEREYQLRREAIDALMEMLEAAQADGVGILVNSAYRSGPYQQGLYERACDEDGPSQRYSAPPGHSEHQLGTCVDLTDPPGDFAFTEEFGSTPQGQWLEANAARFGFKRSYYPANTRETGYISEPWHWRYWGR